MEECNLDWKKVFKEILGPKSPSQNSAFTKEHTKELSCSSKVTSSEVKNSIGCDSSRTDNAKISNEDAFKSKTLKHEWDKVNHFYSSNSSAFKESFVRKKLPVKQLSSCIPQDQRNSSYVNKGDEVLEWDSSLKHIGNISSKDVQERRAIESKPVQKQNVSVKSKRFYKKKEIYRNIKAKNNVDEERKRVEEIFARSRSFKPVSYPKDLAGSGVNTFNCSQLMHSLYEENVPEEPEILDDSHTDYSNLIVPITGVIANMKPLSRSDVRNAPVVPLTEIWDDDFLF